MGCAININFLCIFKSCVGLFPQKILTLLHFICVEINSVQPLVLP